MDFNDRLQRIFNHQEVRPVPYTVWFDRHTEMQLNSYYCGEDWKKKIDNAIDRYLILWEPLSPLEDGIYRDIHGTVWRTGTPLHILRPGLSESDIGRYSIPEYASFLELENPEYINHSHNVIPSYTHREFQATFSENTGQALRIVGYGPGLFERAWMIRGYEDFFAGLISEPQFCEELLDAILVRQLDLLDTLCRLPIDGIIFADDWGDQRGVTIGPDLWRRFIKPRVRMLFERVHKRGKLTFQHTCGNVLEIVPDLIEIGLDCLQSLQPEAMPVYELKRRYGGELILWGGLGTQQLLPFGTTEDIRKEVIKLKRELGVGGGYIFSSCKPIMKGVPVENAAALIEASVAEE